MEKNLQNSPPAKIPYELLEKIKIAISQKSYLNNSSLQAALVLLVSALHKLPNTDEFNILKLSKIFEELFENYDLKFMNSINNGESFFICIDLFLKLLLVFFQYSRKNIA